MKNLNFLLKRPFWYLAITLGMTIPSHIVSWSEVSSANTATSSSTVSIIHDGSRTRDQIARSAIQQYCSACHRNGRSGIDFNEDTLQLREMRRNQSDWETVVKKLRQHEMPPRKYPQPAPSVRAAIIAWIEQDVLQGSHVAEQVIVRRLQRSEYVGTVRDLLGIRFEPTADFPRDEHGWLECVELPDIAPELMAKYRAAAGKLLDQAIHAELSAGEPLLGRSASHVFTCDGAATHEVHAREILADFTRRAYRVPAEDVEMDHLLGTFVRAEKEGKNYAQAIKAALLDVLTSPHFLYRSEELAASGTASQSADDQFRLASRLSFFLWRSGPDEELLTLAERGELTANLAKQARRMLKDPRSQALAVDFAGSWLSLGNLDAVRGLDAPLRLAMRQESEQFVATVLREDRSVLDLLNADFTFVNERLAKHYGIADVRGQAMRRVPVDGTQRGGVLTHASVLTVTSFENETSPVIRGKWVLENLLGSRPIKPPPGLAELLASSPVKSGVGSVREHLELHRTRAGCAECHAKMDPLGLALENFDVRGAWRTELFKKPVDALGILPNGELLNGPKDLKAYLLKQHPQFVRGLSEKLLQFALDRKLDDGDRAALADIAQRTAGKDHRFTEVILEVVQSAPFHQSFHPQTRATLSREKSAIPPSAPSELKPASRPSLRSGGF